MSQASTVTETTHPPTKSQGQGTTNKKGGKKKASAKEPKPPKTPKPKKEKPVRATPAHMGKVDKVAAMLPSLSDDATVLFTAANNMSTADMNNLVQHLSIAIRRRGITAMAQGTVGKLEPGNRVKIRSGQQTRFIGLEGTVSKVQRIRCYVRLDGRDKDDYFFISDLAPVSATQGSLAEVVNRLSSMPAPVDIATIEDEDHNATTVRPAAVG
jgi:hypothetical protein